MAAPHDRIVAIQGLRAVAILLVVAYHLGLPIGAGFVGVDVFFVISGFVITRMVVRRSGATHRLSLKAFWAGRIRRLLPALAAMITLTVLLAIPFTSPFGTQAQTALTGIAADTWVSNGYLAFLGSGYFASNSGDNPLMHTWSLAVEEQFYLFFPLLVAVALWWTRRRGGSATTRIARWLGVVGVVSLAACLVLTFARLPLPVGGLLAFYSPVTRAWEFAAGALLAVAFERGWVPGAWSRASILAGAVTLVVGLVVIDAGEEFPGWVATIPVLATVLLLIGAVTGAPGVRVLDNRPAAYVGDISYSWYLFHWPVIVFATSAWTGDLPLAMTATAAVTGLALAVASYHWVEQPIRTRRVLPGLRTPLLAALVVVPTVLASIGLYVGAHRGWGDSDIAAVQAQLDHGQWKFQKVCQAPVPVESRDISACRIEGDPGRTPLILVGDSNAGVYAELMVSLAADLHRTVTIATVPSCALTDVQSVDLAGSSWLDCRDFFRSSMDWLSHQPPSTVVMADGMAAVDFDKLALRLPDGRVVRTAEEKRAAWQASLERSYRELAGMGHQVVQVERVPHFLDWRPAECTLVEILRHGIAACGERTSRRASDREQAGALAAERAAARATGVEQIKLRDVLCPDDTCRTNDGDTWYYEDGGHLSFAEALSLKPRFEAVLGSEVSRATTAVVSGHERVRPGVPAIGRSR